MNRDKLNQAFVLDSQINQCQRSIQLITENKPIEFIKNLSDETQQKVMKYALSLLKKELKELNEQFNKL